MKSTVRLVVLSAVLMAGVVLATEKSAVRDVAADLPGPPPMGLAGGADSIEALIDELLAALEKQDKGELTRLRVSEEEYRKVIVPGRVEQGNPPRQPAKRNVDYFWSTMDFKSGLYADNLVENFGGRKYAERRFEFSKPSNHWAWYTAYGELRMRLVAADDGKKYLLQAGWIVEVDGVYKFLSYEYDS